MKALRKYLKNREDAINSILEKDRRSYRPSTFHKLRVEIKKLNAFFDLINGCSKDFKRRKTFKPFKLIFRQAGKVRELQVEEAVLKKYSPNNLLKDYRKSLMKLRLKEREVFFSIANNKFTTALKKSYREIVPFLTKTDKKKVSSYLEKKRKKIEEIVSQNTLQAPQIHALRKRLKEFDYNRNSLDLEKQNRTLPKKGVLPELLGKWHDDQVIIRHLKKAIEATGVINPNEVRELKKIETKIFANSKVLFNNIKIALTASDFFRGENKIKK